MINTKRGTYLEIHTDILVITNFNTVQKTLLFDDNHSFLNIKDLIIFIQYASKYYYFNNLKYSKKDKNSFVIGLQSTYDSGKSFKNGILIHCNINQFEVKITKSALKTLSFNKYKFTIPSLIGSKCRIKKKPSPTNLMYHWLFLNRLEENCYQQEHPAWFRVLQKLCKTMKKINERATINSLNT